MKNLILLPIVAAVALLSGCAGNNILTPPVVQQGVATGVSYSSSKYPKTVPYLRVAGEVICSAANETNLAPASIVAAIENNPAATSLKSPEGTLILNSALVLYIGIWNSYGSNALASAPEIQPYLKATCDGITQGLPAAGGALGARRMQTVNPSWPLIQMP